MVIGSKCKYASRRGYKSSLQEFVKVRGERETSRGKLGQGKTCARHVLFAPCLRPPAPRVLAQSPPTCRPLLRPPSDSALCLGVMDRWVAPVELQGTEGERGWGVSSLLSPPRPVSLGRSAVPCGSEACPVGHTHHASSFWVPTPFVPGRPLPLILDGFAIPLLIL